MSLCNPLPNRKRLCVCRWEDSTLQPDRRGFAYSRSAAQSSQGRSRTAAVALSTLAATGVHGNLCNLHHLLTPSKFCYGPLSAALCCMYITLVNPEAPTVHP